MEDDYYKIEKTANKRGQSDIATHKTNKSILSQTDFSLHIFIVIKMLSMHPQVLTLHSTIPLSPDHKYSPGTNVLKLFTSVIYEFSC